MYRGHCGLDIGDCSFGELLMDLGLAIVVSSIILAITFVRESWLLRRTLLVCFDPEGNSLEAGQAEVP